MESLDTYRGAVISVLRDWMGRAVEKPRAMLPVDMTTTTLRYVRQTACRRAGRLDCAAWQEGERATTVGEYPCVGCADPAVPMAAFSRILFGIVRDSDKENDERVLRRWVQGGAMSAKDYHAVLANAWTNGWLSLSQAVSLGNRSLETEASGNVLRRFLKRLRERKSFRESGVITEQPDVLASMIHSEKVALAESNRVRAEAAIRRSPSLDPEIREWLLATDLPQEER